MRWAILLMMIALLESIVIGCSGTGNGNPATPPDTPVAPKVPSQNRDPNSQRVLWGVWNISFDPVEYKFTVQPARNALAHYNIKNWLLPPNCYDCLKISVNSYDPVTYILDADVTLRNPTQMPGFDVRGILYTGDAGYIVENADDWTPLFDIPGGEEINPFRAFAKGMPHRIFFPGNQHTQKYLIYIPPPLQLELVRFAVDASWPNNCKEPYEITNFWQEPIYDFTGSAGNIYVDVRDWQDDVNTVTLVAPEIAGGDFTQLYHLGGDTWSFKLANSTGTGAGDYYVRLIATSSNSLDLPLYDFNTITITESLNPDITGINPDYATQGHDLTGVTVSGIGFVGPGAQVKLKMDGKPDIVADIVTVIDESTITCDISITPEAAPGLYDVEVTNGSGLSDVGTGLFEVIEALQFDPVDVTPPWLNFSPYDVCVDGNYAYIAAGVNGLHIFDISDPSSPIWVNRVTSGSVRDVTVAGGYAYVAAFHAGLKIIDIDPPESAYIVKSISSSGAYGVDVSGGYAYLTYATFYESGLRIIDIDPPESAYIVNTVDTPGAGSVAVSGGYAYVATAYLQIIDIDPPESAYIVNVVNTPGSVVGVTISDGYAYVADGFDGLSIIDIDPPESAYTFNSVDTPGYARDVALSGAYAYVADRDGLQIIDIDPPGSAYIVNGIDILGSAYGVAVSGGYAYVADKRVGLHVIDIDPPGSAYIVNTLGTPAYACGVAKVDGYAYVADRYAGLRIIDIEPPESAYIVNTVDTPGNDYDVAVSGGFAYVAAAGLQIIDIGSPESAYIVKTVGAGQGVALSSGYAYLVSDYYGLQIINIDPPESAYIVNTVDTPGSAKDVALSGAYAYVADGYPGLQIIDIDPPESAYIVKTVNTPHNGPQGVGASGGYAYVSETYVIPDFETWHILHIIDVEPPDSAYIIKQFSKKSALGGASVSGAYAYVPYGTAGLQIIDVAPPEFAYIVKTADTPGSAGDVFLSGEYAYVADGEGGLRIIKLW